MFPAIAPGAGHKLYCLLCVFVCYYVPLVTVLYCTFQSHVRIPVVVMVTVIYMFHMSWKMWT